MDFTIRKYKELLQALIDQKYTFQTFEEFIKNPKRKVIILRHDVDQLPQNSLLFAKIQNELEVKGSYYFREVPESWDQNIIMEISSLGHEIGYHYETMDTAGGNIDLAMDQFRKYLSELRKLVNVNTICMHGSPRSKFDNKAIWGKYDYKDSGIIGEPYFDIDFNQVFYLTDTGRKWDGHNVSVRDKVKTSFEQTYHSTDQIIGSLIKNEFPNQIMFTFHPQRWHTSTIDWIGELIFQNVKNIFKKLFFVNSFFLIVAIC